MTPPVAPTGTLHADDDFTVQWQDPETLLDWNCDEVIP